MDVVKIDRFFCKASNPEPRAQALVQGVIQLAHTLGYIVVGEGVETEAERQVLLKLGCDQVQGFLMAKAMPVAETTTYIEQHRESFTDPRA